MTTIVATPKMIFADSYCNDVQPFGTNKLHHVKWKNEEYLMGGCGYLSDLEFFARLLGDHGLEGMWRLHFGEHWPPKIMKRFDSTLLVVTRQRKIYMFDNTLVPMEVNEPFHCIGSGGDWARAYMDLVPGATPEAAIAYAATKDDNTRAPIHTIKFKRKRGEQADG